jgi:hypothetical protein
LVAVVGGGVAGLEATTVFGDDCAVSLAGSMISVEAMGVVGEACAVCVAGGGVDAARVAGEAFGSIIGVVSEGSMVAGAAVGVESSASARVSEVVDSIASFAVRRKRLEALDSFGGSVVEDVVPAVDVEPRCLRLLECDGKVFNGAAALFFTLDSEYFSGPRPG